MPAPITPPELATARAAFEAVLRLYEQPACHWRFHKLYRDRAALGLRVLDGGPAPKKLRMYCSKCLYRDDYDNSVRSRDFELACEPGRLTFSSKMSSANVAYSWVDEFECVITADKQFPVTAKKLHAWLTGFTRQLADPDCNLWFDVEK